MAKLDLTKKYKEFYTSSAEPNIVEVPAANFLTIEGRGAPGGEAYIRGIEALYAVAYGVKFKAKAAGNDYVVCKLEGLWWFDDPTASDMPPPEEWNWKLMTRQPDFVTREMVDEARSEAQAKKKIDEVQKVAFESFDEGLAAQIMHIGPYSEEGPTYARLVEFVHESGHDLRGLHHEVYLTDPRRASAENMRTILRHPIRKS